jgi:hypothetical protein
MEDKMKDAVSKMTEGLAEMVESFQKITEQHMKNLSPENAQMLAKEIENVKAGDKIADLQKELDGLKNIFKTS